MITLGSNLRTEDERDRMTVAVGYTPGMGEALGAKVAEGFKMTTTRLLADEIRVSQAEREAYGNLPLGETLNRMADPIAGTGVPGEEPQLEREVQYTTADYEKSPYFRKGIKWQDGWSEVRARVMAEDFDDRRYREELLKRRAPAAGLGEQVLGFGASMLGNLADPINFIPMAAGIKGATLAASVGRAAAEGALGTALADAIVIPDLKARGEDLGFADAVADVAMGAALGGLLGGAGYGISKALDGLSARRAKLVDKTINQTAKEIGIDPIAQKMPADFENILDMKVWDGKAPGSAARAADAISMGTKVGSEVMTPENFLEAKLGARTNITGVERQELHNMLESAIDSVSDGRAVDLGEALKESDFYKKLPQEVQSSISTAIAEPERFAPALERAADIDKAISEPVELLEAKRIQEEGRMLPAEEEGMMAAEAVEKQVDSYEQNGLQIAECVWGVTDA